MNGLHGPGGGSDHRHHSHIGPAGGSGGLRVALLITAAFMAVEVVGGLATGSLALLADAGHMATDAGALLLAVAAAWLARRPATPRRSFGLYRAEVLAALANGTALLLASAVLLWEAGQRLSNPPPVDSGPMLAIALAGLAANAAVAWVLTRDGVHAHDLNTRGVLLHVVSDMLGSVAAVVAALIIRNTGWAAADPLLSALIGLLIVGSALRLLRDALEVLLESAPGGLDLDGLHRSLAGAAGVAAVHDLHVWTLGSGVLAASAHVELVDLARWKAMLPPLMEVMRDHGIAHATLQPEEARPDPDAFRGCTLHSRYGGACAAPALRGPAVPMCGRPSG